MQNNIKSRLSLWHPGAALAWGTSSSSGDRGSGGFRGFEGDH